MKAGWEYMQQGRPSTGTADRKESYQLTQTRMDGLWPDDVLAEFKPQMLKFEQQCWQMGMNILSCFAIKLGFDEDFFTQAHDPKQAEYQSTLRLLHYLETDKNSLADKSIWRAGAHTDFDCMTLLFQKPGQGGLQLCPGKEASSDSWTSIEPIEGVITCNIGDMLMRWSDDQLKSTLHRVRMPQADEYLGPRYSMAFFCQANTDVVIQGPEKKYQAITAADYLKLRLAANFAD
jgi:isopenicillin N synthase-like dioxygenase